MEEVKVIADTSAAREAISNALPKRIKLDKDLAARLRKLNDRREGVQQFVQMITRQGEERLGELMNEGRGIWDDVQKRYGIDLENVSWNLDKDGETIVPVALRLG